MILSGFTRITQSQVINEGKSILHGYHIEPSSANPRFSIYEGIDAESGRLLFTSTDYDIYTAGQQLDTETFMDRGIYVKITSGVTAVTIYWSPFLREI